MSQTVIEDIEFLQRESLVANGKTDSQLEDIQNEHRELLLEAIDDMWRKACLQRGRLPVIIDKLTLRHGRKRRRFEAAILEGLSGLSPPVTKYQSPQLQWALELTWKEFVEGWGEEIERPILATAETGNFNAFALAAPDGGSAIVFEDEVTSVGFISAYYLSGLFDADGRLALEQVPDMETADESEAFHIPFQLFEVIKHLVVAGSTHRIMDLIYASIINEEHDLGLTTDISRGFSGFVVGHEMAHLALRHHQIIAGTETRNIVRPPHEQDEALRLWLAHYKDRGLSFDEHQLQLFLTRQQMEVEADAIALSKLLESVLLSPADPSKLQRLIGGYWFFWAAEFVERTTRLVERGVEYERHPLWSEHYLVQDLCLRGHHPSPLSRKESSLHFFGKLLVQAIAAKSKNAPVDENWEVLVDLLRQVDGYFERAWAGWLGHWVRRSDIQPGSVHPRWQPSDDLAARARDWSEDHLRLNLNY